MGHPALMAPVVLLLLVLLLARLERWLDASAPPLPSDADRRWWHRTRRGVRSPSSLQVSPGRRLLDRSRRTGARPRRPAAAAGALATARRTPLRSRLRSRSSR